MIRRVSLTGLTIAIALATVAAARADITPSTDARALATAMASDAGLVVDAAFEARPLVPDAHGVSDIEVLGFPRDGETYTILTNGDARSADVSGPVASEGNGGGPVRGVSDEDVSILRVDLAAGPGATCLLFDFQFFTREPRGGTDPSSPPEWNDAFVAELNTSSWTTHGDGVVEAPDDFALDRRGDIVGVASSDTHLVEGWRANYRYASPILTAAAPLAAGDSNGALPGNNSLYLSIFDQGGPYADSAAFIDHLRAVATPESGGCARNGGRYPTLTAAPRIEVEATGISTPTSPLRARLVDDAGNPMRDRVVQFFESNSSPSSWPPLCVATTGADGIAACQAPSARAGVFDGYLAFFGGDSTFMPAFANGPPARAAGTSMYWPLL